MLNPQQERSNPQTASTPSPSSARYTASGPRPPCACTTSACAPSPTSRCTTGSIPSPRTSHSGHRSSRSRRSRRAASLRGSAGRTRTRGETTRTAWARAGSASRWVSGRTWQRSTHTAPCLQTRTGEARRADPPTIQDPSCGGRRDGARSHARARGARARLCIHHRRRVRLTITILVASSLTVCTPGPR